MPDARIRLHCNGRALEWLRARIPDPAVREALSPENVRLQVVGHGHRAHFSLTRPQAEKALALLDRLEALRTSRQLPPGETDTDSLIFTNSARDIRACLNDA